MSFLKKKTIVNEMAEQAKKVAVKYNLRELYIKCDQETVWEKPSQPRAIEDEILLISTEERLLRRDCILMTSLTLHHHHHHF